MIRLLVLAALLCPSIAHAWSAGGHHLIGLLAYHLLDDAEKVAFQELLAAHPRFAEDFKVPGNVTSADRWKAGRAGYRPDVARRQPNDNQLKWQWEDAMALVQNGAVSLRRRSSRGRSDLRAYRPKA